MISAIRAKGTPNNVMLKKYSTDFCALFKSEALERRGWMECRSTGAPCHLRFLKLVWSDTLKKIKIVSDSSDATLQGQKNMHTVYVF